MDNTSIAIDGSKIAAVTVDGDTVRVQFEPAYLIKHMTGSVERTRWWQHGARVFEGAELDDDADLSMLPAECSGGDVGENIYTYGDMVPVPLESRGRAHCAQEYYPAFKAHLAAQDNALPGYVKQEFEDYLKWGRLEHGFLRVRCDTCHSAASAPVVVLGAWPRVQRCWSTRSFQNSRCANGC